MKRNIILIAAIVLLLLVIVSGIIIYMLLNTPKEAKEEPIKIDKNVMMISLGNSFVNNVKDSKKICKLTFKVEIDKEVAELVAYRESEIRDRINALVRSKTEADLEGKEGQEKLQKEIVEIIQKIINSKKIKNVYFDEFIVQ
ncbi:MAG TPA: flagellar basal body-associated FliL family protein [Bacillota bacterium]|jgi:flagellar FliL protein|nr:flagellar basal body-associated FliL family protein [Bacillota bacterium]HQE65478.1 flagellar basal body-associated FliL family protein [Bacillota bacterium]HQI16730.1 flagellar basal body-associated FliL family protein [Bacillota bacterium]HQJ36870.1 flagellar basal body-associated FliL family protein [Bacillota bacterium]HQL37530.1 flagellar basal body-associated FliL family protein [Bacillota bacterium]